MDRTSGHARLESRCIGGTEAAPHASRLEPRCVGGTGPARCRLVRDGVLQVVDVETLGVRVDGCGVIATRGCAGAEEQAVAQAVREAIPVPPALEGAERRAA